MEMVSEQNGPLGKKTRVPKWLRGRQRTGPERMPRGSEAAENGLGANLECPAGNGLVGRS